MPAAAKKNSREEILLQLGRIENEPDRRRYLSRHKALLRSEVVTQLADLVHEKIRVDTKEALRLAEGALMIGRRLRRKEDIGLGLRAKANALYACGDNRAAVEHHEQAFEIYEATGNWKEAARTLSSSLQPLILLGEYDRAFKASERAREIFTRIGETRRIASLDNNVGNIFHRQDRFEEAMIHYERAYKTLAEHQDWERVAITLHNMAMCLISLNDFPKSLDCYQKARELCVRYDMPLLRDQADYNIAYLYYFRGEYSRAIEMLFATRRACEATGDAYHFALCHLDLSEIYLELNLSEEAREMAHEGFLRFEKLGMGYEAAKTLANEAIAFGQQGKTVHALELFTKARAMFAAEKNLVWPWLLDLYQGLLLFHEGRYFEARRLCGGAAAFFDQSALPGKAALAHLLLARIALQVGELPAAQSETDAASSKISGLQFPVLAYQTHFLGGQLAQTRGDRPAALAAYQEARKALEALRSRLHAEELKISFVKNRLQVYEALVELHLSGDGGEASTRQAFSCIEAAKSRSMTEMIFQSGQSLPLGDAGQSELVRRIRDLREDLNWYYHRIELEQLRPEETTAQRLQQLQEKALSHENELLRTLRELPAQERENATLEAPAGFSLEKLQATLPDGAALIEYYSAGDRLVAAVVTRNSIEITSITVFSRVLHLLQLLRFQLSKFRMGATYTQRFEQPLLHATQNHLEALHAELIAPLTSHLNAKHLIFVPHGPLHFLPFHALKAGDSYLCDSYTISYAPSATVFALCQEKPASQSAGSLIMGIPDDRAPHILAEVQSVASILPKTELFLGGQATAEVLKTKGAQSALLHIATHGTYRQDNPMFSGIRLGDGYLNLYDLYQMRLSARHVTLSGCATGMNFVAAGDELLGLQRGLFCAGAGSLLLALWDVHDRSTAELMQAFYKGFTESSDMASSLQSAMKQLRQQNPHPYFWAPFVLVGQLTKNKRLN
ncbi:MAG TPA: CHAT domain-containing tetratricopeptide repeat protein [Candidatus Acidoferrum sp.]|nr:CHAT domain-containing tetratricopeptide repeat protein [Candidatus Acidoferrum sp.]